MANSSKTSRSNNNSNSSSKIRTNFLKRAPALSEHEGGSSNNVVPKGYLAVCVGLELRRFVIPTEYLSHQAFHKLLRETEEEFGFEQTGVLRIPCEVSVFESILKIVSTQKCRFSVEKIMGYCSSNQLAYSQSPMCR